MTQQMDDKIQMDETFSNKPLSRDQLVHPTKEQQITRTIAVIPCFNEQHSIGSVVLQTKKYVDEVLVIDDGSEDNTTDVARMAGATVISHRTNQGKSAGVKTGFQYALDNGFDYAVTLDGDGQHNPDEIPMILDKILSQDFIDMSVGTRSGNDTEMPRWRRVGKRVLDYATSFGNEGFLTDSQCGFRAFNKKALSVLAPRLNGNGFSSESEQLMIAGDMNLSVASTHVSCKYQSVGDAHATSTKSPTSHGFGVLGYVIWLVAEKRPLLFIGVPGFLMSVFSVFWAILTFQLYNRTGVFPISYALITGILLMVGALALFMGLLLNTIPHIVRRTLEEKEYDSYMKNQSKIK
ncbi:MAG: glycosyltransferase family 2 protein [Thermoplasmatota archaeon]